LPGDIKGSGNGQLNVDTSAPTVELQVKLGGLQVLDKKQSACGEQKINLPLGLGTVDITALTCPAKAGPVTVNIDISTAIMLPKETQSHAVAKDENGDMLLCLDVDIKPVSANSTNSSIIV